VSSHGSVWPPVALGLVLVVAAGAGSYAWLAASAPSRASSAAAPSAPQSPAVQVASSAEVDASDSGSHATGYDRQHLDALAGLVPASLRTSCAPAAPIETGGPPASASLAAMLCLKSGNTIVYETLPDLTAARSAFASLVTASGVEPGTGACWDGSPGTVAYSYGQVACWTDRASGAPTIAWTYEPANVLASVSGSSGLRALVNWWWFHALLQPAASASGLTTEEEALVGLLPVGLQATCDHYDPVRDASGYNPVGSLGSVDCFPKRSGVADVGFFQFTTAEALAAWYDYRVTQAKVKSGSGGCLDGTPGETEWEHGRVLCFVTAGRRAAIRWTDDRYQVYGALNATGKDLRSLVDWWTAQDLP
jgi:hypothetical protein